MTLKGHSGRGVEPSPSVGIGGAGFVSFSHLLYENVYTMKTIARVFLAFLLAGAAISCGRKEEKNTDIATFPLRGEVVEIDTAGKMITIAHHDIPNYMRAMTMPFRVKNPALLHGVAVGDSVHATLAVSRVESWLETLTVLTPGAMPRTKSPEDIVLVKVFRTGDRFPDATLQDQDGRNVRFSDFRGKVLAMTFVYTRCPLPDYCIRMSAHFAALQKTLSADTGLRGRWQLMTVSFDPAIDRPAVMKCYGESYAADFATWKFATDPDTGGATITRIADGLGLMYAPDEGRFDHNLRTVLIDAEGNLVRVINGNTWTPEELATDIRQLAKG
jgi:protein SCO1/2